MSTKKTSGCGDQAGVARRGVTAICRDQNLLAVRVFSGKGQTALFVAPEELAQLP